MFKPRAFLFFGVSLYYFLFYCNGYRTNTKSNTYQVVVKKIEACENPQPPFPKKRPIEAFLEIITSKGRSFIRGNTTIKAPVPFRNFSAQSFLQTGAGHREVKLQILGVSCRNFMAAAILKFTNVSFSQKDCMLLRGFYTYFADVDKITHSLPIWHALGYLVHRIQVVAEGATVICSEIHVQTQARGQRLV